MNGRNLFDHAFRNAAITMADFAVAVVDRVEAPQALNRRAAVGPPE